MEDLPCRNGMDSIRRSIQDYTFNPEPIFYGEGTRYYGCELEIDGVGEDEDFAYQILQRGNKEKEHIYLKHDGSLKAGFEIVSHPMTLDYHMNIMPWERIFKKAVNLGYRSHHTNTCGLHIHINRNSLGKSKYEQTSVVARIIYFMESNWDKLFIFSRRSQEQIKQWSDRYGIYDTPYLIRSVIKSNYNSCYSVLNLNHESTIEFRLFRGTLRYTTFIAALQLVDEICNTAFLCSDSDFISMDWNGFVGNIRKDKKELINYLKFKGIYNEKECEL